MELKQQKTNFFLYWAAFSVNLLSINSGSMYSWASPTIPKLTSNDTTINPLGRPITSSEESIIAAIPVLGCIVGTVISGYLAEKIGRKKTLIIFSVPYFFSYLIIANARQIIYFYILRFILGIATGCVLCVLPSYVAEISENSNRGALGNFFGFNSALGHFLAFAVGPLVSVQTFAYILMVPVSLFFITFIPFVPESPYHFLTKNDTTQAKKSLKKIRSGDIEKELMYLMEVVKENLNDKVSWKDITSSVATRNGLFVCCGLLLCQQALGIGVILIYMQPILDASGNIIPSYVASVLIGTLQIIACGASTLVIDRLGRKILLHVSSAGCTLSLFGLGVYFVLNEKYYNLDAVFWLPVTSLIAYYIFFNLGYAAIPWIMIGEVFTANVKSLCSCICALVCLISSFLVTLCFPFLRDAFGIGTMFCIFGSLGSLASIFVVLYVPETKGKSFEEIQYQLSGKKKVIDGSQGYESS